MTRSTSLIAAALSLVLAGTAVAQQPAQQPAAKDSTHAMSHSGKHHRKHKGTANKMSDSTKAAPAKKPSK
jgi:hypothetical protein